MRKLPVAIRHYSDRKRHQRHAMQLSAPVFAEEVAGPAVLIVVLKGNEGIEYLENFAAHRTNLGRWDDRDEIISSDMSHKAAGAQQTFHYVVKNPGQNVDDSVAIVVAVTI